MADNYTIAEEYELPSKGLVYDEQFDPHIKLRSMTVREEMKRMSSSSNAHKNLCEIIDDCLITKLPISCYDMAIGDYEYLLHKLRVVTYGEKYKIAVGCPHCQEVYETEINLDDLEVKDFDLKEFDNCRIFTLPVSKDEIKISFQTARILDSIDAKVKEFKRKNKTDLDPTLPITLQTMIDTVNGNKLSYIELETYVNKLSARDANFIMNRINKIGGFIGLDTEIDVSCAKCGGGIITYFRFGSEFFRPSED